MNDGQISFLLKRRRASTRITYHQYAFSAELNQRINVNAAGTLANKLGLNAEAYSNFNKFSQRSLALEVT